MGFFFWWLQGYSLPFPNKAVLEPRVSPAFAITYFSYQCNMRFDPISAKTWNQRSLTPRWPLTPFFEVICVTLPKDHCNQVPWKFIKVCGYSDPFLKTLNQRSLTPRWPLIPHLLRSHVSLYPRIIVSKSHGNTSKYVDTVINFAKNTTYCRLHTTKNISPSPTLQFGGVFCIDVDQGSLINKKKIEK